MSSKYGRLFTEADVRRIVDCMADGDADREDYQHRLQEALGAAGPFLTFPVGEPLFLLRGKDGQAQYVVADYADRCEAVGCGAEHVATAREAAEEFHAFVLEHPERVKARPD